MNQQQFYTLNRHAALVAMISACFPAGAQAAAGRVEFAIGGVSAISDSGETRSLNKGAEINPGDTIRTTDGRVQVRFTDGGYMSFQPNTQFKVEDYQYNGKTDGSEKGLFRLLEGGLRAVTGAIGHVNRNAYKMSTPVATIGIRGTEYIAVFRAQDQQLFLNTTDGALYIKNDLGDMVLYRGQSGLVNANKAPERAENQKGASAQGPNGSQQNKEDEDKNRQNNSVFAVNDQRTDDGSSIAISGGGDAQTIAAMQAYQAANAVGFYFLDSSAINTGSSSSSSFSILKVHSSSELLVQFGTGNISGGIVVHGASSEDGFTSSFSSASFSVSGSLKSPIDATFTLSGSGSGSLCYTGSCTFSANGIFTGTQALKNTISYTVGNIDDSGSGVTGSGQAGFVAEGVPVPLSSSPL